MNFRPELAEAVMAGRKTVTRRLVSPNPRSPWYVDRCGLKVGRSYAVCPGRGKDAIGRVTVTDVSLVPLHPVSDAEARAEGFADAAEFWEAFQKINGEVARTEWVWRIAFAVTTDAVLFEAGP